MLYFVTYTDHENTGWKLAQTLESAEKFGQEHEDYTISVNIEYFKRLEREIQDMKKAFMDIKTITNDYTKEV